MPHESIPLTFADTERVAPAAFNPTLILAVCGTALVLLIALGLFILMWPGLKLEPIPRSQLFVATQLTGGAVWLGAVFFVRRQHWPARALWIVLAAAAAMRVLTLAAPPLLSSDIYRYVWDGRVQRAGINPFRYIPDAPELAFLRDEAVFPNINRADFAPTIYPPTGEAVFAAAAWIAPGVWGMKAMMTAFDVVAILALLRLLRLAGRDATQVLIYAWLPLPIWEFDGNGHVDAIAAGLLALAVLSAATWRGAARTGMLIAAAALTKFLPGVVFPAFWRPRNWRVLVGFAATLLVLYTPYVGIGWRVFGYLPGYAQEEHLYHGGGVFLLQVVDQLLPLPHWCAVVYAVAVLALLGMIAARFVFLIPLPDDPGERGVMHARQAAILGAVLLVALSPHYPWYFAWLAPLACLASLSSVYWLLITAPLLSHGPAQYLWLAAAIYVPAMLLAGFDLRSVRSGRLTWAPPR